MVAPHPDSDARTASELYAEFKRLAASMVPGWKGAGVDGEFGDALLRIASRMGAHVTQRVARTPRKDSVEFYNMLDIPADAPVPAEVPLVFLLNDKTDTPVFAAAGVQVSASSDNGEVVFETSRDTRLTPARLSFLVSADGDGDRIDQAPDGMLVLEEPADAALDFTIVSFADVGSRTLQLEPVEGLEKGDYLEIAGRIYQLDPEEDPTDGLVDLTEGLETRVGPEQLVKTATRIDHMAAFRLPNLQAHDFYVGHNELFNLANPAKIEISIQPSSVIENLPAGIKWELWGTKDGEEGPTWHEVEAKTSVPGTLELTKDWVGSVDSRSIGGQDCRWLRAHHTAKISAAKVDGTRVQSVQISVATLEEDADEASAERGVPTRCADFNTTKKPKAPEPEKDETAEKALSITQAFHNGTPLPLTTRFFPFGPEPQRFDTFSIAAPEAFSKKNARVSLLFEMPVANIAAMAMAESSDGPSRAYIVAENGRLQVMTFENGDIRWIELSQPEAEDLRDQQGPQTPESLGLNRLTTPQAMQYYKGPDVVIDVIVVRDKARRFWRKTVNWEGPDLNQIDEGTWRPIPPPGNEVNRDVVIARAGRGGYVSSARMVLFSVADDKLRWSRITGLYSSQDPKNVENAAGAAPTFGPGTRISPVYSSTWPSPRNAFSDLHLLVLDSDAKLWRGKIAFDYSGSDPVATATWSTGIHPAAPTVLSNKVRPIASHISGSKIAAFAASVDVDTLRVTALTWDDPGNLEKEEGGSVNLADGAEFRIYPSALSTKPMAAVVGSNADGAAVSVWTNTGEIDVVTPPDDTPSGVVATLSSSNGAPALVVNGASETVHIYRLGEHVSVELHHAIELDTAFTGADFIEPEDSKLFPFPANPVIDDGTKKVYSILDSELVTANTSATASDWRLWRQRPPPLPTLRARRTGSIADDKIELLDLADHPTPTDPPNNFIRVVDPAVPSDEVFEITSGPDVDGNYTVEPDIDHHTGTFDYEILDVASIAFASVTDAHLKTLAKVTDVSDTAGAPQQLRFLPSQDNQHVPDPLEQDVLRSDSAGNPGDPVWAQLKLAWILEPNAQAEAMLLGSESGQWRLEAFERGYESPELAWEYFDGESWRRLSISFDSTNSLANSGVLQFVVPRDLSVGEVAGQEDYWVRARLIGGDYGSVKYIVNVEHDSNNNPVKQEIDVDRSGLQPPEILSVDVSFTISEKIDPEFVLTYNNLTFRNQTQASASPDASFEILEGVAAINGDGAQRVIYLGMSKRFDGGPLTLYVDADDQERETKLVVEVRGERDWQRVSVDDETAGFHRRGYVNVSVDTETRRARYFDRELYWLRVRPASTDSQWSPTIRSIHVNAVRSLQAKSLSQEIVGSSSGEPGQRLLLAEYPVIPESLELRVRESLTEEERIALNRETEGLDAQEQAVTRYDDTLSIDGDWVRWTRVDSFQEANDNGRVFRLDAETGRIEFGERTRIPPAGANGIRAITYQSGGGEQGNLPRYNIESPKSSIRGLEKVSNPIPSSGGTNTPSLDEQLITAPARLRHSGLALARPDIEAIAAATSPDVVTARCVSPAQPGDPIRVAVAVRTGERCPSPSIARREGIARAIQRTAWGALDDRDIRVESPEYVHIKLSALLRTTSVELAARLEERATQALRLLTHPVAPGCGPRGNGWSFGRSIFDTDVLRAVSDIEGFDRVVGLDLTLRDGGEIPDALPVTALICAENDDVEVSIELPGGEG